MFTKTKTPATTAIKKNWPLTGFFGVPGKKTVLRIGIVWLLAIFVCSAFGPSLSQISQGNWGVAAQAAKGDQCAPDASKPTQKDGVEQADGSCKKHNQNTQPSDVAQNLGQLASFLANIFTPILAIETTLIGGMMGNELVMGTGGSSNANTLSIETLLNKFWIVIRDIVNYAFILVLLAIAFMTVVSAGGGAMGFSGNFKVGAILPKFVVAVVLVNFTWFGARVILDAANVAAHVVYGIPQSIPEFATIFTTGVNGVACTKDEDANGKPIPLPTDPPGAFRCPWKGKDYAINTGSKTLSNATVGDLNKSFDPTGKSGILTFSKDYITSWDSVNQDSIASLFAFGILQIQQLPRVQSNVTTLTELTIQSIVVLVIMIILLLVFTAMFFVLLERVIMLWVMIVLSPMAVLLWVLDGFGLKASISQKIGIGAFMKWAFLPAYMGLPLVLGLMMVIIGGGQTIQGVFANFNGINTLVGLNDINTFQRFLWYIIAIGILWFSMSIAEETSKFTGSIVKTLKGAGEGMAKYIAKAPLYATWIPVGVGRKEGEPTAPTVSIMGAWKGVGQMSVDRDQKAYDAWKTATGQSDDKKLNRIIDGLKTKTDNVTRFLNLQPLDKWTDAGMRTLGLGGADAQAVLGMDHSIVEGELRKIRGLGAIPRPGDSGTGTPTPPPPASVTVTIGSSSQQLEIHAQASDLASAKANAIRDALITNRIERINEEELKAIMKVKFGIEDASQIKDVKDLLNGMGKIK